MLQPSTSSPKNTFCCFCCRSWSFSVLIFSKWVLHLKLLFLKSAPFKITHYFNHWSCGSDCDICWSLAVLSSGFRYRADIASPRPCLCPYPIRLGGFACGAGWLLAGAPTCKKEKHVHAAHATLMSSQEEATACCRASHYGLAHHFHAARLLHKFILVQHCWLHRTLAFVP